MVDIRKTGTAYSPAASYPHSGNIIAIAAPVSREQKLTAQLAEQVTEKLSRIRQQLSPQGGTGTIDTEGVGSVLDIRA